MKLSIHLYPDFHENWIKRFKSKLDHTINLSVGQNIPDPPEYQVLIAGRPPKKFLDSSPNLHTLIIPWAGLPETTRELLKEYPALKVHNLHHNALPAAESAIALMLAAARKLIPIDKALRKNDWRPRYDFDHGTIEAKKSDGPILLSGKTALILGYGAIGKQIGRICSAMGLTVYGITRTGNEKTIESASISAISHLNQLLPDANILFVSLPMTLETKGLIGKNELSLLPDQAIVVNIARGLIIDEKALYEELASGRLRAGLDVWYHYPQDKSTRSDLPPSEYPFHKLDNVVMTPHLGGHSDETENLRIEQLADMLNRAARGEKLPNPVDPSIGY